MINKLRKIISIVLINTAIKVLPKSQFKRYLRIFLMIHLPKL